MTRETFQTLDRIRDNLLENRSGIFIDEDIFTEYCYGDWKWATDSAREEFLANFDKYNNWVFEDDYETEEEWNVAKNQFKLTIVREWR